MFSTHYFNQGPGEAKVCPGIYWASHLHRNGTMYACTHTHAHTRDNLE